MNNNNNVIIEKLFFADAEEITNDVEYRKETLNSLYKEPEKLKNQIKSFVDDKIKDLVKQEFKKGIAKNYEKIKSFSAKIIDYPFNTIEEGKNYIAKLITSFPDSLQRNLSLQFKDYEKSTLEDLQSLYNDLLILKDSEKNDDK